ncbi:MAG: TadE/TadG family type IV pilus assembly protein [Hasllibacter sp.]
MIRKLRRFLRREDGFMAMEFAILMPAMMLFLCFGIETGVLMARAAMFDRAVDIASRDLRLGTASPLSYDAFRHNICMRVAIIGDCHDSIQIEVQPIESVDLSTFRGTEVCQDRSNPTLTPIDDTTYTPGVANQMMLIRACVNIESFFPGSAILALIPRDANDDFRLLAVNAFVHEPI